MKPLHLLCIAAATLLAACTLETSGGDTDGLWHLTGIDTTATGGHNDMSGQRVFWGIQAGLIDMRDYDNVSATLMSHYQLSGDSLFLLDHYHWDRPNGDPVLEDTTQLRRFGIGKWRQHYKVLELGSKYMRLRDEQVELRFRKL